MSDIILRQKLVRLAAQQPAGSPFQRQLARVLYADFDPNEIEDIESGPLEHDSDESFMSDQFNQQEVHELGEKQERGLLQDGKIDDGEMKMAADRALFRDLIKLAHTDKKARDPILTMLREAGLISAKGEVPEAFKKEWKNKDKDGDGKENEPKPDFLKDKKASRLAPPERQLFQDLVKLAHSDKTVRGPILTMLREAGLLASMPLVQSRKATLQEGPVGRVLDEYWNMLHDFEGDLEKAASEYDMASSYGGPAKRDAQVVMNSVKGLIQALENISSRQLAKLAKLERDFIQKYGDPDDYVREQRNQMFPRAAAGDEHFVYRAEVDPSMMLEKVFRRAFPTGWTIVGVWGDTIEVASSSQWPEKVSGVSISPTGKKMVPSQLYQAQVEPRVAERMRAATRGK